MCKQKSCLGFKGGIYFPMDNDNHSEMLNDRGCSDTNPFPNFVKLEIYPDDENLFDHRPEVWTLHVDQDRVPEWFDFEKTQQELREVYLPKWWAERFIINREVGEITDGIWYLGCGGTLHNMRGGILRNMRGGTLQDMRGGILRNMHGGIAINRNEQKIYVPNNSELTLVKFGDLKASE